MVNKRDLDTYVVKAQTLKSKADLMKLLADAEDLMDRSQNGYSNYLPSEVSPVLKKVREIVLGRIEIEHSSKSNKILACIKRHLREAKRDLPTESSLFANDLLVRIEALETNDEFLKNSFELTKGDTDE